MLSAEEAFEKSKQKLEETVQSIDDLLIMDTRIKDAIDMGGFATLSDPMPVANAEKLALDLEEYGFSCGVQTSGMVDINRGPLVVVSVNWKWKPLNSRVKQPASY